MACVYRHIRLDTNQPFYVGIGASMGRAHSKNHRNNHWHAITNKTDYRVDILFEDVTYSFAKEKEIEFIEIYKRKEDGGLLCNITKGGEGCLGLKHTDEAKAKMSARNKGKKISEEQKKKVSAFHKGRKRSEETRRKLSESSKGRGLGTKIPEHVKEKMRLSARRGENNSISKLSEIDIINIRELKKSGISQRKIAMQYNVVKNTIASIINGKTWSHV